MSNFEGVLGYIGGTVPIFRTLTIVIISIFLLGFIITFTKRILLKHSTTKKQKSSIEIFSKLIRYIGIIIIIAIAFLSYGASWGGVGLTLGLLSAALGWALQRPITGIAAWIMVIIRRPFEIGDRIIIGTVRGDVEDISLTHIYLKEIGGIVGGEENSGRIILVPNAKLFEQDVINYTLEDDYVLDQVAVTVTYEGNLDKAIEIALKSAEKHVNQFYKKTKLKKPYILTYFEPNGINVRVRYFAPATRLQEISSIITKEIYDRIIKESSVEIAYPHTEIIYREKKN